jgi:hypothetical protein
MSTLKVKDNQEFARWFEKWIAIMQQRRTPADKTVSAKVQKHPSGSDTRTVANKKNFEGDV